jgi:hypothetical protein
MGQPTIPFDALDARTMTTKLGTLHSKEKNTGYRSRRALKL